MNHCLLMMGGVGSRFGADIPKQYVKVGSNPIFLYILKALIDVSYIDSIVIVSNSEWVKYVKRVISKINHHDKAIYVTEGGANRSESVKNGLLFLSGFAADNDVVLIHDATHPYVDKNGVLEVINAVNKYGGATLGACQYDTCYRINEDNMLEEVIPRQFLVSGASPEAFKFKIINDIYQNADEDELANMTSAGAIALHNNIKMKVVPTDVLNLKITYANDMKLFKLLKDNYFFKKDE